MGIDHLFQSLVLPKILYGLPVYAASVPELNTVQRFLCRCHKRCFIPYAIDIYNLLEKTERSLSKRISNVYLIICCIICCPELKNPQNVKDLKEAYHLVLTQNVLKLVSLIDCTLNILSFLINM